VILRSICSALLATSLALASVRAQEPVHVLSPNTWLRAPASSAALNARIDAAAAQYRSRAPIPRVAFWDVAYPADSAEFAALGGNALLLVIALDQDSSELPLARTWMRTGTGDTAITQITSAWSRAPRGGDVEATFGPFRYEALFAVPVALLRGPAELLTDFTSGRQGFRIAAFAAGRPSMADNLPRAAATAVPVTSDVFKRFLRREYPGFAIP
jgi:hypothetical protein